MICKELLQGTSAACYNHTSYTSSVTTLASEVPVLSQQAECTRENHSVELQQTEGKLQAAEVQLRVAHGQTAAMVLVQQAAHRKCTELEQQIRKMQVSYLTRCLQSCGECILAVGTPTSCTDM